MTDFSSIESDLSMNPRDEKALSSLLQIVLTKTKPQKPYHDSAPIHPNELHCHICGSLLFEPTTSIDGSTACSRCSPPSFAPNHPQFSYFMNTDPATPSSSAATNLILFNLIRSVFKEEHEAMKLKEEGNKALKAKKIEEAVEMYSRAIQKHPDAFTFYLNRSAALLDLGKAEEALHDAELALERAPFHGFPKPLLRIGNALLALNRKKEAIQYFATFYHLSDEKGRAHIIEKLKSILSDCAKENQKLELKILSEGAQEIYAREETGFKKVLSKENQKLLEVIEKQSDFEETLQCTLCYSHLYEPLTTPCGHSFCKICLVRSLDHRDVCPLCRSSLKGYLAIHEYNVTTSLTSLISHYFPQGYQERELAAKAEQEEFEKVLPIFVCTLALPGVPCPLHVFEPRYRLMMRRCMESGTRTFGMCVYIDQNGRYGDYGTCLFINQYKALPDGRSLIETMGTRRFKVKERMVRDGYNVGKVEYIEDDPVPPEQEAQIQQLESEIRGKFRNWRRSVGAVPSFRDHIVRLGDEPTDVNLFSWWALGALPISDDTKYELLPGTNLLERLETVQQIIQQIEQNERCKIM